MAQSIEKAIKELREALSDPLEVDHTSYSGEFEEKMQEIGRELELGAISEETAEKRARGHIHQEIRDYEEFLESSEGGRGGGTLLDQISIEVDEGALQRMRGKLGRKNKVKAKKELRLRVRDVLEVQDEKKLKKIIAEMKALSERIRDNAQYPGLIVLREVRQFYEDMKDAVG